MYVCMYRILLVVRSFQVLFYTLGRRLFFTKKILHHRCYVIEADILVSSNGEKGILTKCFDLRNLRKKLPKLGALQFEWKFRLKWIFFELKFLNFCYKYSEGMIAYLDGFWKYIALTFKFTYISMGGGDR